MEQALSIALSPSSCPYEASEVGNRDPLPRLPRSSRVVLGAIPRVYIASVEPSIDLAASLRVSFDEFILLGVPASHMELDRAVLAELVTTSSKRDREFVVGDLSVPHLPRLRQPWAFTFSAPLLEVVLGPAATLAKPGDPPRTLPSRCSTSGGNHVASSPDEATSVHECTAGVCIVLGAQPHELVSVISIDAPWEAGMLRWIDNGMALVSYMAVLKFCNISYAKLLDVVDYETMDCGLRQPGLISKVAGLLCRGNSRALVALMDGSRQQALEQKPRVHNFCIDVTNVLAGLNAPRGQDPFDRVRGASFEPDDHGIQVRCSAVNFDSFMKDADTCTYTLTNCSTQVLNSNIDYRLPQALWTVYLLVIGNSLSNSGTGVFEMKAPKVMRWTLLYASFMDSATDAERLVAWFPDAAFEHDLVIRILLLALIRGQHVLEFSKAAMHSQERFVLELAAGAWWQAVFPAVDSGGSVSIPVLYTMMSCAFSTWWLAWISLQKVTERMEVWNVKNMGLDDVFWQEKLAQSQEQWKNHTSGLRASRNSRREECQVPTAMWAQAACHVGPSPVQLVNASPARLATGVLQLQKEPHGEVTIINQIIIIIYLVVLFIFYLRIVL